MFWIGFVAGFLTCVGAITAVVIVASGENK